MPLTTPYTPIVRESCSLAVRVKAATNHLAHPTHTSNGDEDRFTDGGNPTYIANYSKGLEHDAHGVVVPASYQTLLAALSSGEPADFEAIALGSMGTGGMAERRLVNPQSGLAFDLEGPDAQAIPMPRAPSFDSAEAAAEMGELYWMSLLRDVPFKQFDSNFGIDQAANSLSDEFSDFRGPKEGGRVTHRTLFRGFTPGDLVGPYVSQFLLKGNADDELNELQGIIRYGTLRLSQQQRTAIPSRDYMATLDSWLPVQNGFQPTDAYVLETGGIRRFIRNMRDLATYVHFDALFEAYVNAALIMASMGAEMAIPGAMIYRLGRGNPYDPPPGFPRSRTQEGFGTFGGPHILSLVTEVATRALKAVWFQKWFVHRRQRPEEFGGRVHFQMTPGSGVSYPIHSDLLNSPLLDTVATAQGGTFFLSQAFAEGSPTHPSYGAGHATVAGACVTILKALFDESTPIQSPVLPSEDGFALELYTGDDRDQMTVGGELNKLAANISIGRNMAGVHWRTDYSESLRLGERIAIGILQDQANTYNEEDYFFELTTFDGDQVRIERTEPRCI